MSAAGPLDALHPLAPAPQLTAYQRFLERQAPATQSRVPPPRRSVTRREVVWAVLITLVLVAGILGTLLLRTAMQTQARALQLAQRTGDGLSLQIQRDQRELTSQADPARLAAQARALRMHPQLRPVFLHRH